MMETIEQITYRVMREKNLSQNKMGDAMGISGAQISDVLSGKTKPGEKFLVGLARVSGLPKVYIYQVAGKLPPNPKANHGRDELAYIYEQLPTEAREDLLDIARGKLKRHERTKRDLE
jgi:transcriptional regulator with XRE-family HTH domain